MYINSYAITKIAKELTYITVATGSSSLTIPATTQSGDILVLFSKAINTTGEPTTVVPAGFTQVSLGYNDVRKHIISYKIATGSDANSSVTAMTGTSSSGCCLFVVRPTGGATSAEIYGVQQEQTDGDPSAQTITLSGQTEPVLVIVAYGQQTATSVSATPALDGFTSILTSNRLSYKIYNSGHSNITVDEGDGGVSNYLASFYMKAY